MNLFLVTVLFRVYTSNMDGYTRYLQDKATLLLKQFPAIAILGARQCGKSTLAKMIFPQGRYIDLENVAHFEQIANDPVLFFQNNPQHLILDEVQQAPEVFQALRGVIDADRDRKNRFILTGSASFELQKNISESLAGRIAIIELSPFKMDEFLEKPLSSFYQIFERPMTKKTISFLKTLVANKAIGVNKKYLLKGGYPEPVLKNKQSFHLNWMENYIKTYITRDIRSLYPRIDLIKYRRVVSMLSFLSGTIINRSEIARSVEASEKSVRDYLDIIAGTYFWRNLEAFTTPKIKTTLKMPKGHFRDSGLTLFLQNIYSTQQLLNYPKLGNVFEAFMVEEILRGVEASDCHNLTYSHFRTKAGAEVDLILEGSFGLLPMEIKYKSYTTKRDISSLIHFVDTLDLPLGIVVNHCEAPAMITEKIMQIPAGCL